MTKIYHQTFGKGKPIVLVHGWAMHSGIWQDFARKLAQQYQVTCIDLPGHGYSENIDAFTLEKIGQLLVDSLPDEPSCWLGWSLGATVVLDIAKRFPDRVHSMILLAGNPLFVQTDEWNGMKLTVLEEFANQLTVNCQATLLRFLSLQVKNLPDYKMVLKTLKMALTQCKSPDKDTLLGGLEILKYEDLRSVLSDNKLPACLILGGQDTLIPINVRTNLLQLNSEINLNIIDKAGHVPFLSHEREVLTIISDFMGNQ